ncbi:DUF1902 domain-containing protein [Brevundimonas sp.]|jgi:hypothetical protein|uniref:DUF1902 domain-containing protein n=1 Tax=Brevundimonas sp. TaxID=1871086 RepID=UPI0037BEF331
MAEDFYVKATWDPEAEAWCSESNIVGLVLQTATFTEFEVLARHFAADLLSENMGVIGLVSIKFEAVGDFVVNTSPSPVGRGLEHPRA